MNYRGIMLTDLDGTLLDANSRVSPRNLAMFATLKEKQVVRVAATGRSLFSTRRVLDEDFPIDFLVFSSGAGILNWQSKELVRASSLTQPDIIAAAEFFLNSNLDFSIHHPIPDTHKFHWYASTTPNPDFLQRLGLFQQFAHTGDHRAIAEATQLLAVTNDCREIIPLLQKQFGHLNIIRTTSPLNGNVVWIEVFPADVSKGHAGAWLCEQLGISHDQSFCIGNDYNDLAMLEWAKTAFIMENAAIELKPRFHNAPHHNHDGFAIAVESWLDTL